MKLYCFMSVLSAFFCCNKTKCFSCLHLVVLFFVVLFSIVGSFLFLIPLKRQRQDTAKAHKTKMQKKRTFSVSAVVFTNRVPSFGVGLKVPIFAETL